MRVPQFSLRGREIPFGISSANPYWQRSKSWWSERSQREQALLAFLAVAGLVALFLVAIVTPLRALRADALAEIRNAALLEARLRAGGPGGAVSGKMRRGTASAIITDSAAAAKLSIQRIEPEGSNTRVVLADASFDQVLKWIADLEQNSRLRIDEASIERKGAAGIVSTTMVVVG